MVSKLPFETPRRSEPAQTPRYYRTYFEPVSPWCQRLCTPPQPGSRTPHPGDHRIDDRRDHRGVSPHLFPIVNVREMYLHFGRRHGFQGVVDSVGVVAPGAGVEDQTPRVCGLVDPADELAFVVRLAKLEADIGKLATQHLLYILECLHAVDFRTPLTQRAQVHTVEDEYFSQRRLLSLGGPPLRPPARPK